MKKSKKHPIKHHVKRLLRLTPKFVHGMVAGAVVGIMVVVALRATVASALSISSPRDCDTNAVVNCGALTTTELQQKYGNNGVAAIYNYFGISAADVNAMGATAAAGQVYKDGRVMIGNTVVATGAITAGRENISGSTKVTSGGVTFYKRPPSVSFRPNSIAAFVVMKDGQFKFAILGACSNPVIAAAIPKAAPAPTPTPTPPPTEMLTLVTPIAPITSTQTPPSTPTPVAQVTAATTVTELPNTGPGAVAIIALLSVIGGYVAHRTHKHIKRKRHAARHNAHS
ncbi:MAG TPA: hypothetical protein VGO07_03695 [Candidatus Saccharimonadales bacterium]|jgi:hypothetical protein|nr:hypothetical protein [Candidatus Saccharimonadales bacterium]